MFQNRHKTIYLTLCASVEKYRKMKYYLILGLLVFIYGCEEEGNGTVSFGSNYGILNCAVESIVFIDGNEIGSIPGYCDSISNCFSDYTLNEEISEGTHSYRIEIANQSGNCYNEKTGDFEVKKDECVRIFFNVIQDK